MAGSIRLKARHSSTKSSSILTSSTASSRNRIGVPATPTDPPSSTAAPTSLSLASFVSVCFVCIRIGIELILGSKWKCDGAAQLVVIRKCNPQGRWGRDTAVAGLVLGALAVLHLQEQEEHVAPPITKSIVFLVSSVVPSVVRPHFFTGAFVPIAGLDLLCFRFTESLFNDELLRFTG
ncbi:hypothetical protein B0H13DRAFT_2355085 [Mycena leptocephala]|nr:hypothetical protein B0H13DRAFT_2355085 [Mycena leptocephala]